VRRELLDLPENIVTELVVSLGYPRKIPNPPLRRKVEDAITRWVKGENEKSEKHNRKESDEINIHHKSTNR